VVFLENNNFNNIDFKQIMEKLGKTVSMSCQNQAQQIQAKSDFLFDFSSIQINNL
jgi:hypothetical protein